MRLHHFAISLLFLGCATNAVIADDSSATSIQAALADKTRPDSDVQQDAERKAVEVLTFINAKPGDRVADLLPGGGYYTRLFSTVVGKTGHVYGVIPAEMFKNKEDADAGIKAIAALPEHSNVSALKKSMETFDAPEKLDVVFTSMNYHDFHIPFMGPADLSKVNKSIFNSLKSGGIYVVLDHAGETGSGLRDVDTLHRIDPEIVKKEVLAAGFVLDAESNALKNPDDDHTKKVFDPSIRGKTDKLLFKFRKP